jgi:multiple sugar transport system substrate-binding protein
MSGQDHRGSRVSRSLSRRGFLRAAVGTTGLLLLSACGGATQAPAPKPTEAPKPAAPKPTEAAKPAAPAAQPAATAAPAGQAAPAAKGPVSLKGTTLSILQWSNFIPDADPFFQKQIQEGFVKDTGAQVNIEFIDQNTIAPKIAAAIQSGSGPDIIQQSHNWAHQYSDSLVDVSDVAEEVKKTTGEFFPGFDSYVKVNGRYLAIPHDFIGLAVHYRKSWFKDAGADEFPKTFDELHEVGKKLKANGHPLGQSLGHSVGDPVFWTYPMMWAYGGREVDEGGKLAINSPETVAAVKTLKDNWAAAYDDTGLAWDDASNNRAFLAETISMTQNGASIWWVARKDQAPFFDDIGLDLMPGGPKGRYTMGQLWSLGIMKYSKNVDAAKEFIKWQMSDPVWMPLFEVFASFVTGVGPKQNDNPIWEKFPPETRVFKDGPAAFRGIGWPGPPDQKAGSTVAKYIVVDMFARAVQGESPEQAVAWAESEMKSVYT